MFVFGKPNTKSDGYKTDAEWIGKIDGEVFTIYNYKTGHNYLGDSGDDIQDITDWHIGGKKKEIANKVIKYFNEKY